MRAISKKLQVDPDLGLSSAPEILRVRKERFGVNYIPPEKPRSYLSFLRDAFGDMTIMILCVSAAVNLGVAVGYERTSSSYAESVAILVSIIVVTNVAAGNDYRKQSQFRKLNEQVDNVEVIAVRDGEKVTIHSSDVVVGDIVTVSVGDIICADGLILVSNGIEVDESTLTGEPRSIRKNVSENPFLLSGTKVMDGSGLFVVIAVGEHSEAGQIRVIVQGKKSADISSSTALEKKESLIEESKDLKSVLTLKLDLLATRIGQIGTSVASICFVIMVVRFCVTVFAIHDANGVCYSFGSGLMCDSAEATSFNPSGGLWPVCSPIVQQTCCVDTSYGAVIKGSPCPWLKPYLGNLIGFFITAITILVVAVPEGLPLAVTLSLAFSVMQMQKDKNLVKHLDACETMGSATIVCSDKTGTLTKNRMTVMRAFIGGETFKPNGQMGVGLAVMGFREFEYLSFELLESGLREIPKNGKKFDPLLTLLAEGIAVNSTAEIKWDPSVRLWTQVGNKTECALLQLVQDFGADYKTIRLEAAPYLVKFSPFNSTKKQSSCVVCDPRTGGFTIHVKGASEIIFSKCNSVMTREGEIQALSEGDERSKQILDKISEFASLAMRTIAVAIKHFDAERDWESEALIDSGLTLLAIVGIEDPLRDEVPHAIAQCRKAGVDVRMVTGDNLDTAIAIARGCGILRICDCDASGVPKPDTAMTGPVFRNRVLREDGSINEVEFEKISLHLKVLARSSPRDKYTLVSGLLESIVGGSSKEVVAVTGDGTNDAPALKRADVGFAMGITGTAVAKEAADIILMDDNFSSIVKAIIWGRNVHESIAKFLQFQLTINIVALVLAVEGAIFASESPLKAVQMLWVNLIMDSLASLALATEPPTDEHLNRPPIGRNKSMLSSIMLYNICGHAIYQLIVLNILLFMGPEIFGFENGFGAHAPTHHNSLIFNSFVLIQIMNQINMRKLHHEYNCFKGLFSSRIFFIILSIEIATQILIVEFGGNWFHTKPLSVTCWLVGVVLAVIVFPVQWLIIAVASLFNRASSAVVPVPPSSDDDIRVAMPLEKQPSFKSQSSAEIVVNSC